MNSSLPVPNLPGMAPSRDSWIYRAKDGFSKSKRPGSASLTSSNKALSLSQSYDDFNNIPEFGKLSRPSTANSTKRLDLSMTNTLNNQSNSRTYLERPKTAGHLLQSVSEINGRALARSESGLEVPFSQSMRKVASVPLFVERDRQVCRFFGYFCESRIWDDESPLGCPTLEREITRDLTILYYIVDDTVEIHEKINHNSGMTGGHFYKRNPLKNSRGQPIVLSDFAPGNVVSVLGRDIHITDADSFTRDFFRKELNMVLPPPMDSPEALRSDLGALYSTGLASHLPDKKTSFGCRSTNYLEKKEELEKSHKFLTYEGSVLRFVCVEFPSLPQSYAHTMDPVSGFYHGDGIPSSIKKFALSYYLADGSVDIRIVKGQTGTGVDENVLIMKRNRIARNWREVRRGDAPNFYEPLDFICGTIVDIYGRQYLLISCDSFTKSVYDGMGIQQIEIPLVTEKYQPIVHPIPQLGDGFLPIGSPEDTLATVYGMPKVSKDVKKIQRNQNRVLRCKLKMLSKNSIDKSRLFMLTFYLEDDTLQIFEEIQRNSGISGGNFLKRGRYRNSLPSDSEEPRDFKASDIYLGNVLSVNGNEMQIIEMDNLSLKFCETYPEEFPMFDTFRIVHRLISKIVSMKIDARALCSAQDSLHRGYLNRDGFVAMLDSMGVNQHLNDQELLTLMRRFQDGENYYYSEMCDLLSHVYYVQKMGMRKLSQEAVIDDLKTLLSAARGRTTPWRRTLRKENCSWNGMVSLNNMIKIFRSHGFVLSNNSKKIIQDTYRSVLSKEASRELDKRSSISGKHGIPLKKASSRADLRSLSRKEASVSEDASVFSDATKKDTIKYRRKILMTSVLRSSAGLNQGSEDSSRLDENVTIDFNRIANNNNRNGENLAM